jgi:hypothetical protein
MTRCRVGGVPSEESHACLSVSRFVDRFRIDQSGLSEPSKRFHLTEFDAPVVANLGVSKSRREDSLQMKRSKEHHSSCVKEIAMKFTFASSLAWAAVGDTMGLRRTNRISCSCAILALAVSFQAAAQSSPGQQSWRTHSHLTEFDAPDASTVAGFGTQPFANNDEGSIVGYYTDVTLVPHGFLRTPDGKLTPFDAPGAGLGAGLDQGTVAYAINDFGLIAGQFEDENNVFHGFLRKSDGTFATFDAPGAGNAANQGTLAWDVNLEGESAGIYFDQASTLHGFVRSRSGEIVDFDPPGSVYTYPCEETCLNVEGQLTGAYFTADGAEHGFLREPNGKIISFDVPGAGTGAGQGTGASSISAFGEIAGYYTDANNVAHSYVRAYNGRITRFDVPQAGTAPGQGTAAFSLNLFGVVTGEYVDGNDATHGFSRSADGAITIFDAPGAGTSGYQGTRPSTNNLSGEVAGWYIDSQNVYHGFLWQPEWSDAPF